MDITILTPLIAACSALIAAGAFFASIQTRKLNLKKEYIVWALERLRASEQRKGRRLIFNLIQDGNRDKIQEIIRDINNNKYSEEADLIRQVCLAFDEIGYLVYKLKLLSFFDILDIYPQTIKIWQIVGNIIGAWRIQENEDTSFKYFEKLAKQDKSKITPQILKSI